MAAVLWLVSNHYILASTGAVTWIVMSLTYIPTLKFYDEKSWRYYSCRYCLLLYTLMTLSSALQYWQGRGSVWKEGCMRADYIRLIGIYKIMSKSRVIVAGPEKLHRWILRSMWRILMSVWYIFC